MSTHPSDNTAEPVFIVNPTAGRGRAGKQVGAITERLRQCGLTSPLWRHTQAAGDATRLTREAVAAALGPAKPAAAAAKPAGG